MINIGEVIETNDMVEKENLDVRTITLGISHRKRDREQLLYPYRKQTYFSYTYRPCRRCGLQELRGFCYHSKDT